MKYLAIFKDSLREALDSKVLYVMIGLSCLVIVLVASIRFEPDSAEPALQAIISKFPGSTTLEPDKPPPLKYSLEDFSQVNETSHPWKGEYQFQIRVREQDPAALRRLVWLLKVPLDYDQPGLSEQERDARKHFDMLRDSAPNLVLTQAERIMTPEIKAKMEQVTADDLADFIKKQLAVYGELETSRVEVASMAPKEDVFQVAARGKPESVRTWPHSISLFFGAITIPAKMDVGYPVYIIEDGLVATMGAGIIMLIATIITAFFIPNMLRKGSIDLLLAKPIRRSVLLVYKFIGGLAFMFINTAVIVVGIWAVLGWRSGLWPVGFLLCVLILTFEFAIFYSVSTLFGVLTRSPIVAILVTCFTWFILWGVGESYVLIEATRKYKLLPSWVYPTADAIHFVLPRYKDLDILSGDLVARDLLSPDRPERRAVADIYGAISWSQTVGFSVGFILLMLGLACWRFGTRDY